MLELLNKVNEIINHRIEEVLDSYGVKDIDDDLITKETDSMPYKFFYDKKEILTVNSLRPVEEDEWQMEVVEYLKLTTEHHLIEINIKPQQQFRFIRS